MSGTTTLSEQQTITSFVASWFDPATMRVFVFGSRAKGDHHDRSDRDIGVMRHDGQKIDMQQYLKITGAAYDLPYRVDVVDFARVDPEFKRLALQYQMDLF